MMEYLVRVNNLMLGDAEIKHIDYYKYLGVKITNDVHNIEEIIFSLEPIK